MAELPEDPRTPSVLKANATVISRRDDEVNERNTGIQIADLAKACLN